MYPPALKRINMQQALAIQTLILVHSSSGPCCSSCCCLYLPQGVQRASAAAPPLMTVLGVLPLNIAF